MKLQVREGILGGVAAGMVMAMVAMMYTLVTQGDLLAPVKQMAAVFFGADDGSLAAIMVGLMLHMMASAAFGLTFVVLARAALAGWTSSLVGFWPIAVTAMAFILVEWALAAFVILPAIDRPLLATFASIGGLVAHAMYGLVLAWWLIWRAAPATVHVHAGSHQHNAA
jgi:hypothetical protein